jgi:hypothetical protein
MHRQHRQPRIAHACFSPCWKIGGRGLRALAAVCCRVLSHWLLADWATQAFWTKSLALFATVFAAGIAFLGAAVLLKIEELTSLISAVRRRLKRTP